MILLYQNLYPNQQMINLIQSKPINNIINKKRLNLQAQIQIKIYKFPIVKTFIYNHKTIKYNYKIYKII